MSKKLTTEQFIQKAKKIHGDKYDYKKANYIGNHKDICIICPEHGEFWQRPDNHFNKKGCPICANNIKYTTNDFITKSNKIHKNKYNYSKSIYVDAHTKVKIICPIHGLYEQSPVHHINRNQGCPKCKFIKIGDSCRKSQERFIKDANIVHNNKYNYDNVNYITARIKVCIICSIHGKFWQTPDGHLHGHGCPICKSSKGELKVEQYLKKHNINYNAQYSFKNCRNKLPLSFDFYLPDLNICIEYDGKQHHDKMSKFYNIVNVNNDRIKDNYCKENNICLIRIPYWEYENIESVLTNIKS